jgi:hypothetical protein
MRWFGYKPVSSSSRNNQYSPISSPDKQSKHLSIRNSKRKADENKADDGVDTDSSIEIIPKDKPPKKRKRSTPADAIVDVNDDSVEMSFYVYVEIPPPPSFNICKNSAKPPAAQTTELGPLKFNSSIQFPDFLLIIANACHTKISNLPVTSMKWKFDRPANAAKKARQRDCVRSYD